MSSLVKLPAERMSQLRPIFGDPLQSYAANVLVQPRILLRLTGSSVHFLLLKNSNQKEKERELRKWIS
jgi:hypothetical protein